MNNMKEVVGFNNYMVSEDGNIYSKRTNKPIYKTITNSGYYQVKLYREGKSINKYVHRLVAETYLDNPNDFSEVNHKDENKLNNSVDNLEWCDRIYNELYNDKHLKQSVKLCNKYNVYKDGVLIIENATYQDLYTSLKHKAKNLNSFQANINLCALGKQRKAYGYDIRQI